MSEKIKSINENEEPYVPKNAEDIITVGRELYSHGWLYATSGNLSTVLEDYPLEIAITASGAHKGKMDESDILIVDSEGKPKSGDGKPSAETLLHLSVVKSTGAGSVIHTHSVWSVALSRKFSADGFVRLNGYEMLKALDGIKTHQTEEKIPIFENTQDMAALSGLVSSHLNEHPETHGFILKGHGLYTWGNNLKEAARNVEAIEYLLEVKGREISIS